MASWAPDEEPPKNSGWSDVWGIVILILFILGLIFQFTHQTDTVFGVISP